MRIKLPGQVETKKLAGSDARELIMHKCPPAPCGPCSAKPIEIGGCCTGREGSPGCCDVLRFPSGHPQTSGGHCRRAADARRTPRAAYRFSQIIWSKSRTPQIIRTCEFYRRFCVSPNRKTREMQGHNVTAAIRDRRGFHLTLAIRMEAFRRASTTPTDRLSARSPGNPLRWPRRHRP